MRKSWLVLALPLLLVPQLGHAANSKKPYSNVDKHIDAGNDTGDSQVDKLNEMQLDQNYKGPTYIQGTPPVPQTTPLPMPAK